jgi:hypothetical protein
VLKNATKTNAFFSFRGPFAFWFIFSHTTHHTHHAPRASRMIASHCCCAGISSLLLPAGVPVQAASCNHEANAKQIADDRQHQADFDIGGCSSIQCLCASMISMQYMPYLYTGIYTVDTVCV